MFCIIIVGDVSHDDTAGDAELVGGEHLDEVLFNAVGRLTGEETSGGPSALPFSYVSDVSREPLHEACLCTTDATDEMR